MNRLPLFVQHLVRYDAQAMIITSGEGPVLRFPSGDRRAQQVTSHADLTAMLRECAPPDALANIASGGTARFVVRSGDTPVQLEVSSLGPQQVRVLLTRAPAGAPQPAQGAGGIEIDVPPAPAMAPRAAAKMTVPDGASARLAAASIPPAAAPAPAPKPAPVAEDYPPNASQLDRWLISMSRKGGSDLHLSAGVRPMARIHGEVVPIDDSGPMSGEDLERILVSTMTERIREEFQANGDADWAYEIPGVSRFRCNAFRDRRGTGGVLRRIPFEILSAQQIGLPEKVLDLCNLTKGLVLVTGPTGSGKSTTLATMIDVINQTRDDHMITIEDPIEFVHDNKRCLVNQREVGVHTKSFKSALRAALREDPDVVLVGEMRDLETIAIAIETAETGHLVFGTLHTTTAPGAVDRMIDQFPADRQSQIRTMLSESLKGVIAQVLCKKKGGGRVAAYEILMGTPAVANLIREGKTFQIPSIMQTSRNIGMCTMNDSLIDLVKRDLVEPKEAYMKSVNKGEMKTLLNGAGFQV
jgi:twitching motility protein PilT